MEGADHRIPGSQVHFPEQVMGQPLTEVRNLVGITILVAVIRMIRERPMTLQSRGLHANVPGRRLAVLSRGRSIFDLRLQSLRRSGVRSQRCTSRNGGGDRRDSTEECAAAR